MLFKAENPRMDCRHLGHALFKPSASGPVAAHRVDGVTVPGPGLTWGGTSSLGPGRHVAREVFPTSWGDESTSLPHTGSSHPLTLRHGPATLSPVFVSSFTKVC